MTALFIAVNLFTRCWAELLEISNPRDFSFLVFAPQSGYRSHSLL